MHARLLWWSLRQRRARHVLNAFIMAITAAVVMLFVAVVVELVEYSRFSSGRELTRLLIMPRMGGQLPAALYEPLKQIDGVHSVMRYRGMAGKHESGASYVIVGQEPASIELTTDFFPVEPDVIEAWKKERLGAIVTEETAKDLRLRVGESTELPTARGPLSVKVVGLSRGSLVARRIAVHYDYLLEFAGNPGTTNFWVFAKGNDVERVARGIDAATSKTPEPAQAVSADSMRASIAKSVRTVPAILGFLGAFLLLTAGLTLANTTAISIRDRRIEIGTMRVLGYHGSTVMRLMLTEAMVVGLFGGVVAIVITAILFRGGVQMTPGSMQFRPVEIGVVAIVAGLLTSILVPLAGALPSTWAAVRTPLAKALRDSA